MKNKCVCIMALSLMMINVVFARTFDFKVLGTKGSSSGGVHWYSDVEKKKSAFFQVKVGSAGKLDDKSKMEIRAATIFKNAKDKKTGVNDVASFSFNPVNGMKPLFFVVATGTARSQTDRYWVDSARSSGWQVAGVIIDIWQSGKMVKHWTNVPGNGGKARLSGDVKQLFVHSNGYSTGEYSFDNATEIFSVNQKGEKVDIEDLLKECTEPEDSAKSAETAGVQNKSQGSDNGGKNDDEDDSQEEFILKTFCGFEFGSKKPEFGIKNEGRSIALKKPFRHYTHARLEYGANSGLLQAVTLFSRQSFDSDVDKTEATAAAAAVIEKKYGITMKDFGSSFYFVDERQDISVYATNITVRRRYLQKKDEKLRNAIHEATKRQIKSGGDVDDGSDVL